MSRGMLNVYSAQILLTVCPSFSSPYHFPMTLIFCSLFAYFPVCHFPDPETLSAIYQSVRCQFLSISYFHVIDGQHPITLSHVVVCRAVVATMYAVSVK